ncbi:MAG: DUF4124 domain-containing protein [Pseudomonadota bacterium]
MKKLNLNLLALIVFFAVTPVSGSVIHKWVDSNGVTHYSDVAPEAEAASTLDIPVADSARTASTNDYYSIQNQWKRVNQERLAREKREQEQLASQKKKSRLAKVMPAKNVEEAPRKSRRSESRRNRSSNYADYQRPRYNPWPIKRYYPHKVKPRAEPPAKRIGAS